MNPVLLLPAGLAALAALALPLLLHLARRDEQRPVDFAALRWLATRLRPRRRLRFEEPLLLALRLLLVALLALLLARPALEGGDAETPWIVAMPEVGAQALLAATPAGSDAGSAPAAERRWLAPGFPVATSDAAGPPTDRAVGSTADTAPSASGHGFASLLRELDMRMPAGAPLVVLVPPVLEAADAERPRLSRPVDWRVVDAQVPRAGRLAAPPPRLVIRPGSLAAGTGEDEGARYLAAAAAAWRSQSQAAAGAGPEVRAWPAGASLSAADLSWIEAGGTALLPHDAALPVLDPPLPASADRAAPWSDAAGRPLLTEARLGRGRLLQWTRPLDPAVFPELLEADFPRQLQAALQPPPAPSRVLAAEHAPVVAEVGPWPAAVRELSPWLALAVALLFALERWLAGGPRGEQRA